jgi:hypothetical protein
LRAASSVLRVRVLDVNVYIGRCSYVNVYIVDDTVFLVVLGLSQNVMQPSSQSLTADSSLCSFETAARCTLPGEFRPRPSTATEPGLSAPYECRPPDPAEPTQLVWPFLNETVVTLHLAKPKLRGYLVSPLTRGTVKPIFSESTRVGRLPARAASLSCRRRQSTWQWQGRKGQCGL